MGQALARLHRRIDAAERSYYRALKELQAQIAARSETEESEPAPAIVTDRSQFALAAVACGAGCQPADRMASGPERARPTHNCAPEQALPLAHRSPQTLMQAALSGSETEGAI
jgi:hypothetical protein